MDEHDLELFERSVVTQAPPGAVWVGGSISPDGGHGVSLTFLPPAYVIEDLFIRSDKGWDDDGEGCGIGKSWTAQGEGTGTGVLRYRGQAPVGAVTAIVEYRGERHCLPVRHGHFLFVAWDVPHSSLEEPLTIAYESSAATADSAAPPPSAHAVALDI